MMWLMCPYLRIVLSRKYSGTSVKKAASTYVEADMAAFENAIAAALSGDPTISIVAIVLASLLFTYGLTSKLIRLIERLVNKKTD